MDDFGDWGAGEFADDAGEDVGADAGAEGGHVVAVPAGLGFGGGGGEWGGHAAAGGAEGDGEFVAGDVSGSGLNVDGGVGAYPGGKVFWGGLFINFALAKRPHHNAGNVGGEVTAAGGVHDEELSGVGAGCGAQNG